MGDTKNLVNATAVKKMKELAESADICMFTTALSQLPLSARPMATMKVDEEGSLWFFSNRSSQKNAEIGADSNVQLFYASKGSAEYLSVYGKADIITDRDKAKELWSPLVKAWFPDGVDDPALTIIKVTPLDSYYWDTKHNKLIALIKIATAVITGKTMDDGVEGKLLVS